ncbi:MAG TPA: ATP-binding protein [Pirellulaceae bacterium]|jgi:signal transduction histidine kinase
MWRTLASRVYVCIAATLALALIVSAVAIAGLRQTAGTLDQILDDNLPSVVAAGELENSLLEQRGYVTAFIVSGDEQGLEELNERKAQFRQWLQVAQDVAFTPKEQTLLKELADLADEYDATRQRVIDLIRAGQTDEAKTMMFGKAGELYRQAHALCEALNETNQQLMRKASHEALGGVNVISGGVAVAIVMQLAISGILLATFYRGVLRPLKQMAIDLQHYVLAGNKEQKRFGDEVESVAGYLRLLFTNVEDYESRLERQQRALFDAQKLATIGRLAASLAHEIRNPLTAMKMWLFTARDAVADGTEVATTLDNVTQEVRRLEAVVRQFLEFSRPRETRQAWTPTCQLLDDSAALVEPLLREKAITLEKEIGAELPNLYVDREQMMQAIVNLLRNAAEAASAGGQITVATAKETQKGGAEAVIRISDSGQGIPEEHRAKLFEPFFTTKDEGTGLGLPIVASIVLRHGGHVELSTPRHAGAEFVIHLPLPAGEPEA